MRNIVCVLIVLGLMVAVRPSVAEDWPPYFMQNRVDECINLNSVRLGKTKAIELCQCIMEKSQEIISPEKYQKQNAQKLREDKGLNQKISAIVINCNAQLSK